MRVCAIRGKDLASLAGDFAIELDQPPLSNLGLFAIHGPVGAGKSTILDTMTLALFGRTPRLSGQGGAPVAREHDDAPALRANDPATLVRRGADSAYAEVDFVGHDGRMYRARWEVRRGRGSKGKPGRLQRPTHALSDVATGQAIGDGTTDVRRAIESRLGLSFDELCRSVLLAQGGFMGFLHAPPDERAALLEKVTGTEIYTRLSVAAHERRAQWLRQIEVLRDEVTRADVLTDDARTDVEARLVRAKSDAGASDTLSRLIAGQLERRRARRARDDARNAVTTLRAAVQAIVLDVERTAAAARNAVSIVGVVRPLARQSDEARGRAVAPRRALSAARAEHDAAQRAEAAAASAVTASTTAHERARAELAALLPDDRSPETAEHAEHQYGVQLAALRALRDALTRRDGARALLERAELDRVDADRACDAARDAEASAIAAAGVDVDTYDDVVGMAAARARDAARAALTPLDASIAVKASFVERLDEALREDVARAAIAAARRALKDGDPCPVCGSTEHKDAVAAHDEAPSAVAAAILEARASLNTLQAERAAAAVLAQAFASRAGTRATLSVVGDTLDAARNDLAALDARASVVHAALDARARRHSEQARADEAARVVSVHAAAEAMHAAAAVEVVDAARAAGVTTADLDAALDGGSGDIAALVARVDGALRACVRAREARAVAEGAVRAAEGAIVEAERAHVAAVARAAAESRIVDDRARACADADADVARADDALRAALRESSTALGDMAQAVAALEQTERDAVARATTMAAQAHEQEAALATASGVLAEREARLAALGEIDEDDSDASVDDETLVARRIATDARAEAARDDAARAGAELVRDARVRDERKDAEARLAAAEQDAAVWLSLAELIGSADGKKLRQFAQGLTLDALIAHANAHLTMLAPRYALRRAGAQHERHDLDLVVVDSDAGLDVRSTHTLSGGETFLVSLALALGLSSLSANEGARGRVDSLFIDEGFSALDPETLDTALAAFDALRQTGRQIGVISHVPLLVERLGAQVRVVPVGGGASKVEVHAG